MKQKNLESDLHIEIGVNDVIHNNDELISSFVTPYNINFRMKNECGGGSNETTSLLLSLSLSLSLSIYIYI